MPLSILISLRPVKNRCARKQAVSAESIRKSVLKRSLLNVSEPLGAWQVVAHANFKKPSNQLNGNQDLCYYLFAQIIRDGSLQAVEREQTASNSAALEIDSPTVLTSYDQQFQFLF